MVALRLVSLHFATFVSRLLRAKDDNRRLSDQLQKSKREAAFSLTAAGHKRSGAPPLPRGTLEENKKAHPELYSVMDEVDGVIVPPRRKGGRRLYKGRRKGKGKGKKEVEETTKKIKKKKKED